MDPWTRGRCSYGSRVRSKPDNQQFLVVVVDGDNQAIVIAIDVKHHSLAGNDAGRAELRLQFCRILPGRLFDFGIPSIQVLLYTSSKPAIHTIAYESVESRSGNDSHFSNDTTLPFWEQGSPTGRIVAQSDSDQVGSALQHD